MKKKSGKWIVSSFVTYKEGPLDQYKYAKPNERIHTHTHTKQTPHPDAVPPLSATEAATLSTTLHDAGLHFPNQSSYTITIGMYVYQIPIHFLQSSARELIHHFIFAIWFNNVVSFHGDAIAWRFTATAAGYFKWSSQWWCVRPQVIAVSLISCLRNHYWWYT